MGLRVPLDTSIANQAMTLRTSILVDDLGTEPAVPPEIRALGLGAGLFCPLSAEERVLGALVVARPRGAPSFSESDVVLVEVFASAAVVAITLGETRFELDQLQATAERGEDRPRSSRHGHPAPVRARHEPAEHRASGSRPGGRADRPRRRRPGRGHSRHPRDDLPPRAPDHGRVGSPCGREQRPLVGGRAARVRSAYRIPGPCGLCDERRSCSLRSSRC